MAPKIGPVAVEERLGRVLSAFWASNGLLSATDNRPCRHNSSMPAELLWQAALLQAIKDACSTARSPRPGSGAACTFEQQQARDWLLNNNGDFVRVCLMADMEPTRIRAWAFKQEAEGWPPVQFVRYRPCGQPVAA